MSYLGHPNMVMPFLVSFFVSALSQYSRNNSLLNLFCCLDYLELQLLPAAGPAAGGPREVVSPSEYRAGVTGSSTAAAQQTVRDIGLHEFQGRALFVEVRTSRKDVFTCCWACRWGPARADVA